LLWFGPVARINIADPQLVQEIFSARSDDYEKIEANTALKKLEGEGLLNLKGEKWAQHRRIINPAFHMENIKVRHNFIEIFINSFLGMSRSRY
jgi:PHYB activation tagged suppressor 1